MKKYKPIIGSKLVPSIENIEGCFKYDGEWNHKDKVCYEKQDRRIHITGIGYGYVGCTAPVKGLNLCWGSKHDIPFVDFILSATGDVIYSKRKEYRKEHYAYPFDSAKKEMHEIYEKMIKPDSKQICCNPRGKIVGCNEPNAIMTNEGKNITAIAHSYRNKFGEKVISNLMPIRREYIEKPVDKTTETGIFYLDKTPALKSAKEHGVYYGIDDERLTNMRTKQFDLKGGKAVDAKLIKEAKVPSVETPSECFAWGGKWDKDYSVCLEKKGWGTAPVKGVSCYWGSMQTECTKYDPDTTEEEMVPCYEPYVTCSLVDEGGETFNDEKYFVYDTMDTDDFFRGNFDYDGCEYPLFEEEAESEAKRHGLDLAGDILKGNGDVWNINYYDPSGKECEPANPNTIAARDPQVVKELYRGHLWRFKLDETNKKPKIVKSYLLKKQKKLFNNKM